MFDLVQDVAAAENALDLRFTEAELEIERERIVDFIRDNVNQTLNFHFEYELDHAIVGLSGGVDSSLVAHLAVEAVGAENVRGIVMPSEQNSEETMGDAERVADGLGIEYDVIEIGPTIETIAELFVEQGRAKRAGPIKKNLITARLRPLLLHLSARGDGGVVVGTSNRSEWLTGHFDRYGDGAVHCQPIVHLYKQQVRQLARDVGVPESVLERTPSPEFEVAPTDEELLGVEYDTLDSILTLVVDGRVSPGRAADILGIEQAKIEHILSLYRNSAYKRQLPPGLSPRWE